MIIIGKRWKGKTKWWEGQEKRNINKPCTVPEGLTTVAALEELEEAKKEVRIEKVEQEVTANRERMGKEEKGGMKRGDNERRESLGREVVG